MIFEVEDFRKNKIFKPTPMRASDWFLCIGFSYLFLTALFKIDNFILSAMCFYFVYLLWGAFCNRRIEV